MFNFNDTPQVRKEPYASPRVVLFDDIRVEAGFCLSEESVYEEETDF